MYKYYKLGIELLKTNAPKEMIQDIINDLKVRYSDSFDMDDIIKELNKRGFVGEYIEMLDGITGY